MKGKALIIAGLVIAFCAVIPGTALAQSISINGSAAVQQAMNQILKKEQACDQSKAANRRAALQQDLAAASAAFGNIPQLDAAMYHCITAYETVKDMVDDARDAADAGAQNPLISGLKAVFKQIAIQIAAPIISKVCNMVSKDLQALTSFALSQINRLCIPIPNLNLSIGALHLPMPQCHGVNLAGPLLNATFPGLLPSTGMGKYNVNGFKAR